MWNEQQQGDYTRVTFYHMEDFDHWLDALHTRSIDPYVISNINREYRSKLMKDICKRELPIELYLHLPINSYNQNSIGNISDSVFQVKELKNQEEKLNKRKQLLLLLWRTKN